MSSEITKKDLHEAYENGKMVGLADTVNEFATWVKDNYDHETGSISGAAIAQFLVVYCESHGIDTGLLEK